jgi:hypothetical protein
MRPLIRAALIGVLMLLCVFIGMLFPHVGEVWHTGLALYQQSCHWPQSSHGRA